MATIFTLKISEKIQQRLKENFPTMEFIFCENMEEAEKHIEKAEIIVTFGGDLNDDLVMRAERLKWVSVLSAGLDQLPFASLEKKNVMVTNVKGIHKTPMAEYVISMLLQVYRNEKVFIEKEQEHIWHRDTKQMPLEISEKTMLIAGTGAIGQEVARLAKAFHMKTIGVSRSGRTVEHFDENVTTNEMKTYLPEADFVISVLPSTKETKNLYTIDYFQSMKDDAVFLNMGRGDVVESDVIIKAVREKEIMHAVLDVFETEPLPKDHPLWDEARVTITPHISGISPNYLPRALKILEQNLDVYIKGDGEYVNEIDTSRGY